MNWTMPYPWTSRSDSVRRINMASEPGNESFFCALRPIPRILGLGDESTRVKSRLSSLAREMSLPSDNVLFVPSRNVLLTVSGWGVGNGPTPDDAEGARPAGRAEESQEETDHAEASGRRNRCKRAASATHVAEPEGAWRQGGNSRRARAAIEPKACDGRR